MSDFEQYLADALDHALSRADDGTDHGELSEVVELCRRGVVANHDAMQPERFMLQLMWCIGSAQKDYETRIVERPGGSFWNRQKALFRHGVPEQIVADAIAIKREYAQDKRYLRPEWVGAVVQIASALTDATWPVYRSRVLPLPSDPETQELDAWLPTVRALDRLPWVGSTTGWYLLRNLLGAPVFKPDLHVLAIAWNYFGHEERPLTAMVASTRRAWPRICEARGAEERVLSPHLGVVDFILWWYRRETGLPRQLAFIPPTTYC